jgi:hypothetical protein
LLFVFTVTVHISLTLGHQDRLSTPMSVGCDRQISVFNAIEAVKSAEDAILTDRGKPIPVIMPLECKKISMPPRANWKSKGSYGAARKVEGQCSFGAPRGYQKPAHRHYHQ